jgi:hypothetical protein
MIRFSTTVSGTQTVRFTTSQVPAGSQATAHGVETQGAEQQWLAFLPKQPPASADAETATASTMERTRRILENSFWLSSKGPGFKRLTPVATLRAAETS